MPPKPKKHAANGTRSVPATFRGRRATIMGLGHFGGGVAAARWLARQAAIVTVTDLADEADLADSLPLLTDVPIAAIHLGGHREADFRDADFVVVNPGGMARQPVAAGRPPHARPSVDRTGVVYRELPGTDHRRHRQERKIDHGGDDGRDPGCEQAGPPAPQRRTFLGGNIGVSLLDELPRSARRLGGLV